MTLPKNSSAPSSTRKRSYPTVFEEAGGIQINFCKNPNCPNFNVPVPPTAARGPGAKNPYKLHKIEMAAERRVPGAHCHGCGEEFPFKSNVGVFEEAYRIINETFPAPSCPNVLCANHWVPVGTPKAYYAHTETPIGSRRYRCRACGKTFSVKPPGINPIAKQTHSNKNRQVLSMLVGKMPLRRICEAADIAPKMLYERIDFFYRQSLAFLAERESKLPEMDIKRLYVSVDRQDYNVNWTCRTDKRNITISAVAAADNTSGYVFGMDPNFDPEMDPAIIEAEVAAIGDLSLRSAYRQFARLWLQADYDVSVRASQAKGGTADLESEIRDDYENTVREPDVESSEHFSDEDRLPSKGGMQVHSEYTLYGHFMRLRCLLAGAKKIRFFLDQDSGMRAACLATFAERILKRECDAFYVRIAKEKTVDEKRRLVRESRKAFTAEANLHPDLSEAEVRLLQLKERIAHARTIGPWRDRWVLHPLPTMAEPEKAVCYLTDFGDYDEDHTAWLYNKGSLHGVDSWFNQIRRRSSLLERGIPSRGNTGRRWYGYSPYKPEQIGKMLTILRACHNYIWVPEGRKDTPAMRLGLAKAPLDYNEIIYSK